MLIVGHFRTGAGIPSNPRVFPSRWETSPRSRRRGLKSIITVVSEVFGSENDQMSSGDIPRTWVSQAQMIPPCETISMSPSVEPMIPSTVLLARS